MIYDKILYKKYNTYNVLWLMLAFISILCRIVISRKNTTVFETKARELEKELSYYNSIAESFEQLRKFRHDMSNHLDLYSK